MAIKVTSKIKQILKARDAQIMDGTRSVLAILGEVKKQIVTELAMVPEASYTAHFLQQSLSSIERHLATWESATTQELGGLLSGAWETGAGLLPAVASEAGITLAAPWLSSHILDSLKEFTFGRIASVKGDLFNKIRGELTLGLLGQKTPQEVAAELAKGLGPVPIPKRQDWHGNWHPAFKSAAERAEVITGTEMGRAFSLATQKSMEAAGDTLPGLKKMWLHAGHPKRPRQLHLHMHGQVRDMDKAFYEIDGMAVHFPRDPKAPIKEVIRCGCTHVPFHPEWGMTADAFAKDFDQQQKEANKKRA